MKKLKINNLEEDKEKQEELMLDNIIITNNILIEFKIELIEILKEIDIQVINKDDYQ